MILFLSMMFKADYSPIGAYENQDGSLTGYLFVGEDKSYTFSITEVVKKMEIEFDRRKANEELFSYVIFYHSSYMQDNNHSVIEDVRSFKAISVKFQSEKGVGNFVALPYLREGDNVKYRGFDNFSRLQNGEILSTQINPEKDYFQDKVEIKPEIIENAFGIKIKKINQGSVGDLWNGIFGFDKMNRQRLIEFMAYSLNRTSKTIASEII